jgi:hypothetical protein
VTEAEAVALVWSWAGPIVGFLGFGAVVLLGLSMLKEITR